MSSLTNKTKLLLGLVLITCILVSAGFVGVAESNEDLIAYWTFDEEAKDGDTAKDLVGGNDAVNHGDPIVEPGKVGESYGLNNEAEGYGYENSYDWVKTLVNLPNDSFAISFWVYAEDDEDCSNNRGFFSSYSSEDRNGGIRLYEADAGSLDGRDTRLQIFDDGNTRTDVRNDSVDSNLEGSIWTHYVITYESDGAVKIYKNASNIGSNTAGGKATGAKNLNIGKYYANAPNEVEHENIHLWQGKLDEFSVWNRPLSSEEVGTIFDRGDVGAYNVENDDTMAVALALANGSPQDDVIKVKTNDNGGYSKITGKTIKDHVEIPEGEDSSGLTLHHNTILGELTHNGTGTVDTSLNYWGSPPDVGGDGKIIQSPWLLDPPGTQNMTYKVADVGADPQGGVSRAVADANQDDDQDIIKVNHGTYSLTEKISSPVTVESELGSANHTFIEDDLVIDSSNVYVGSRMKGFTVVGDVTVTSGSNTELHWNQINGKLINESGSTVDAVLNSWDGQPEVEGQNVVYSPWIVGSPDNEELLIIVDETKGAKPKDGYLDTALGATNGSEGQDEIVVNHGEYEASKSIEAPVDIHSEHGSAADTHVHESLTLESADILIGHKGEGFTIHDDVTVASGVDASTIHINWNNIYGTVTNNGSGTLDATYNYWGDEDPSDDTVGKVNYDPYLPTTVGEFRTYMEANGFTDPDKALNEFGDETDTVGLSSESMSTSDLAVMRLREAGFDGTEANQIVSDFGADVVLESYRDSGGYNEFVERLMGYEVEPAGEEGTVLDSPVSLTAAGNGKSVDAEYEVGEQIEVGFSLKDYQGKEVRSELATVTVARVKDDEANIIKATPATYDEEEGAYRVTTSTEELGSGTYQLYIDLKEGSTTRKTVQVVG